jgi:hypothetical protein
MNIDWRVCRALSLLDADKEAHNDGRDADGAMAPAAITGLSMENPLATASSSDSDETQLASGHVLTDLTRTAQSSNNVAGVPSIQGAGGIPQPTIGMKKAKQLVATQAASAKNRRGQGPNAAAAAVQNRKLL